MGRSIINPYAFGFAGFQTWSDAWDPAHTSVNITLSSGNSVATDNVNFNWDMAIGLLTKSTGDWHATATLTTISSGGTPGYSAGFGVVFLPQPIDNEYLGQHGDTYGGYLKFGSNSEKIINGVASAMSLPVASAGDIVDVWIRQSLGYGWFGKNGTPNGSGDPIAGTNPDFTFTPGTALNLACAVISFAAITLH